MSMTPSDPQERHWQRYLLAKPEAILDYPFGPEAAVFKLQGKMFALLSTGQNGLVLNLKCDPLEAVQLRDLFAAVRPGYHMNKQHWNSVSLNGELPDSEIERQIDNSYALIVRGLTRAQRRHLELKYSQRELYGPDPAV
jgi:predicted DNA-binding protein (MmcQ/YjbR family)